MSPVKCYQNYRNKGLRDKCACANEDGTQKFVLLEVVNVNAVIRARGMDHSPAAQADAHMSNTALTALTFAKEKQVARFKRRLNGSGSGLLHIGIARDFNPDPVMEQARKA